MSITLELSDEVTRQAEQYARQRGCSLAALVEEYLRQVVANPSCGLLNDSPSGAVCR